MLRYMTKTARMAMRVLLPLLFCTSLALPARAADTDQPAEAAATPPATTAAAPVVAKAPAPLLIGPATQALQNNSEGQEIVMFVGEIKTLPANNLSRVAIGNGKLVSTRLIEGNQMLLIAEGVGDTSLVLWTPNGKAQRYMLRIGSKDAGFAYRTAKTMLGDIPSIQIRPMGASVAITGSASPSQIRRIAQLASRFPQLVPLVQAADVEMKKMVYMKVQILEVKKSLSEALGVSWPGTFAGPTLAFSGNLGSNNAGAAATVAGLTLPLTTKGVRTYLGISSIIQSTINLAKNNGDLTILAEPELSARSGDKATFLAGGQIPVQSSGALGTSSVDYKDYGIKLSIAPTADDQGNVIAKISAELSQVDSATAVNGIPGFLTRKAETEINVQSGQTMVISGLISRDMQHSTVSVPGLGSIPILGHLFKSDSDTGNGTDLLIAVTPVVIDANSTINRERIQKSLDMKERFERDLSKQDFAD